MNTDNILNIIESAFPFVEKPIGMALSFHKDDCLHCKFALRDIEEYSEKEIPREGLRKIYCEMSMLSAEGWRWVLPSYLRFCVSHKNLNRDDETEFLIYNLAPDEKFYAETIERLAALNALQIECLIQFLEWAKEHEHWSTYCAEEIEKGLDFLRNKIA